MCAKGSFALPRGKMKKKNGDALRANMDILKTGPGIMSILNLKAISLILQCQTLEKWVT